MWGWLKKAAKGFAAAVSSLANDVAGLIKLVLGRLVNIFEFALSLFGIYIPMRLRVHVIILSNGGGELADEARAHDALDACAEAPPATAQAVASQRSAAHRNWVKKTIARARLRAAAEEPNDRPIATPATARAAAKTRSRFGRTTAIATKGMTKTPK